MNTLCLVMVVGNDAGAIRACLDSAKDLVDCWVICACGSTDGTKEIVREVLADIPGTLHELPDDERASNKSKALHLAKGKGRYHLLLDADMLVRCTAEFRDRLNADSYLLRQEGALECWVERVVSDRFEWHYAGSAHEFIRAAGSSTRRKLANVSLVPIGEKVQGITGAQERIALLKQAVERGSNVARSTFYLAQNYLEIGNLPQALEHYERRTTMGGWDEEVWYSMYQVARIQQRLGVSWILVLNQYLRAYQFRPSRAEPLFHAGKYYRDTGQEHLAYMFLRAAMEVPFPDDLLCIERSIYEERLPREYALCCEKLGVSAGKGAELSPVPVSEQTSAERELCLSGVS